jgi:2-(1,2-epoxy-1,2-dihydrophenyl)acetyl-CoA isomerase
MTFTPLDTGTPDLLARTSERVCVLTLNRPQARNALSAEMKRALLELLPQLARDPGIGCVLLTGAGSAFCAGGDTREMTSEGKPLSPEQRKGIVLRDHQIALLLHTLPQPTLAALPGPAAGAGFALALACNLRIASDTTFFTTAYARLALSGDYGSSWFLTRLVGPARAAELMFTGDRIDAHAAERLGLVNRVVPAAELERESMELARRIAAGPPIALRWMKDNLQRAWGSDLAASLALEAERACDSAQTDDYAEALAALREKRAPQFRGR